MAGERVGPALTGCSTRKTGLCTTLGQYSRGGPNVGSPGMPAPRVWALECWLRPLLPAALDEPARAVLENSPWSALGVGEGAG